MAVTFDVVSIGTLSHNPFWGETKPVRTSHATTTLVRDGGTSILVDPSLPAEALEYRLSERTSLKPAQVQAVFLTTWRPVHRRGLHLFDHADWLISPAELAAMRKHLEKLLGQFKAAGKQSDEVIADELDLLRRCKPAPDKLTANVHLFPASGASSGNAGLLIASPLVTVVVAGDAVVTREYLDHGQPYEKSYDPAQAKESMSDILDVGDQIIPGHDNLLIPPARR
jgi:glyoxylase-like metal-dependent hydrolase (beta-lactamase superfamily II)